jgi:hypothetical protein
LKRFLSVLAVLSYLSLSQISQVAAQAVGGAASIPPTSGGYQTWRHENNWVRFHPAHYHWPPTGISARSGMATRLHINSI